MDFLQSLLNSLPGAVGQGLIWGIMAIGVYITYRVLDVADLTVDGSLATGGAVCVLLMLNGMNAYLAMLCAVLAGMLAGLVTGLFHTRCGIPAILAGILTQLALYSINLRVMGWGTAAGTQATLAIRVDSYDLAVSSRYVRDLSLQNPIPLLAVVIVALIAILYWFFGTEVGCGIRATGANRNMSRAQGINTGRNTVIGLMISNGLVALAGALLAQYQGSSTIDMGRGAIVIGLAAVIIGEVAFSKWFRNFSLKPPVRQRRKQTMLELKNISKTFHPGTVNAKTALRDLSLTLNDGGFVTVIGGNGAGKSTMLNAIAGVFPVDCGSIRIDGRDITGLPEHKRAAFIGRVFQDPMMGTAGTMGIEENLALAARRGKRRGLRWGITRTEREDYRALLATLDLGLENRLSTHAGLLSGGQRQALTLLMAALVQPKLLLLDEHTAALDPKTAAKVLELSDRIVSENHLTTLMVTHNMRDAIEHGNRLIMMSEGEIVLDISGKEKERLTVEELLERFSAETGTTLDNDRILLGA